MKKPQILLLGALTVVTAGAAGFATYAINKINNLESELWRAQAQIQTLTEEKTALVLASEKAAADQALKEKKTAERQKAAEERAAAEARAQLELMNNTEDAWEQFSVVLIDAGTVIEEITDPNDLAPFFQRVAIGLNEVSTTNVDSEVRELIDDMHTLMVDGADLAGNYQAQLETLQSDPLYSAAGGCGSNVMSESSAGFWRALELCLQGAAIQGGTSTIQSVGAKAKLDSDTQRALTEMESRGGALSERMSIMPAYLEKTYGISVNEIIDE